MNIQASNPTESCSLAGWTDLCRGAVVGGVVEGGWERWLVGQAGVLALDGVRVLVGVTAVVVAPGVPTTKKIHLRNPRFSQSLSSE